MKKGLLFLVIGCILVALFVIYLDDHTGKPVSRALSDDGADYDRGWSMDDFSHIQIGVSTKEDLMAISPRYTTYQRGRGEVIQFPLDDGRTVEFVCQGGIVSEISFRG